MQEAINGAAYYIKFKLFGVILSYNITIYLFSQQLVRQLIAIVRDGRGHIRLKVD